MMKLNLFSILVLYMCCGIVTGLKCSSKTRRQLIVCGEKKCCCSKERAFANCQNFGKKLTYIPPLPPYIRYLFFRRNYLPSLSRSTFGNLNASIIKGLFLIENLTTNITEDAFLDFKNLKTVDLSDNTHLDISSISEAFRSLPSTNYIKLKFQNISMTSISEEFLKNLYQKKVYAIDFSKNRFNIFNISIFWRLRHLKTLKVSGSGVYDIVANIEHSTLNVLDLSYNKIGRRWPIFCRKEQGTVFQNLTKVLLKSNGLYDVSPEDWNCLRRLKTLDVSENLIEKLRKNSFAGLTSLTELRLSNMKSGITKIEKSALNNSHLEALRLDGNAISFDSAMANTCYIFANCPNLKNLTLSHNNFYDLSDSDILKMFSPLKNLMRLTIESARMRLVNGFLALLPNLTYLNLDFNRNAITGLGVALKYTTNLKNVSLQGNSIQVVKEESFNGYTMGSVQRLNLADNPFECTCEMLWFRNAIDDTGKVGNITLPQWPLRYICNTPNRNGKEKSPLFSTYKPTKYSCQNQLLIAVIGLVSSMILCTVVAIIVYRYRWYIAYWAYKLKTRDANTERHPLLLNGNAATREGVAYDGYVIYDSADAEFVHNNFRVLMEEKFGYKLHIWERDSSVGQAKVSVIADAIYASKNVVAVISENVFEDNWLQFQLNIALDRQVDLKRDFLILVLLENIDYKKLSKFWCVIFTRILSTRWCSDENNVKRRVFEQQLLQQFRTTSDECVQ